MRSMSTGYLVIRCVTSRMHSGTPWRRSSGDRAILWGGGRKAKGGHAVSCIQPPQGLTATVVQAPEREGN